MQTTLNRDIVKAHVTAYTRKEKGGVITVDNIASNVFGISFWFAVRDLVWALPSYREVTEEEINNVVDQIMNITQ